MDEIPISGSPEAAADLLEADADIKAGFYYTSVDDGKDGIWLMQCHKCLAIGDLFKKRPFPHEVGCAMLTRRKQ